MTPIRLRPHKYRAKPTVVDGIRFHSQKEARRYQELKLLESAGKIHKLVLQPRFPLAVMLKPLPFDPADLPFKLGEYRADFVYCECGRRECEGEKLVVEDVKGMKTPLYRWKKKHFEAQYGIQIREI